MRFRIATGLLIATGLVIPAGASACSCAGWSADKQLRGSRGAVIAKLKHVEPIDKNPFGKADFTYRVNRVYKGRDRYGLHAGDELVIRSYLSGATCGLPRGKRTYGLFLYGPSRRPSSSLCSQTGPGRLRNAAEDRDGQGVTISGRIPCAERTRA